MLLTTGKAQYEVIQRRAATSRPNGSRRMHGTLQPRKASHAEISTTKSWRVSTLEELIHNVQGGPGVLTSRWFVEALL